MEGRRLADLHAYVDDCLDAAERRAFETQMAEDPALLQRAARWRAQNNAIRAAFDGEGAWSIANGPGRKANDHFGNARRPATPTVRLAREQGECRPVASGENALRIPAGAGTARLVGRLGLAALSVFLICAWAPGQRAPSDRFAEAGVTAFGAFAQSGSPPVEFANHEPGAVRTWLTVRLNRPLYLPATPNALNLIGARIAPATGAAAAFLVYETNRNRLGMLVQPLDAPLQTAPRVLQIGSRKAALWTSAGQGYVLVGDVDALSLRAIAGAFFSAGYALDPPAPERGS